MRLFLIRHGESEANRLQMYAGQTNVPLSDKGREDALSIKPILEEIKFDKIYSSDLKRAVQTAQNAIPGCKPETSPLLREINVGNISYKPLDILTDADKKEIQENGYVNFDGESSLEFKSRISDFMKKLENLECDNIVIFSHGGWLRTFLDIVAGQRHNRGSICCNNCAIGIFEYENKKWKLHSWINLIK